MILRYICEFMLWSSSDNNLFSAHFVTSPDNVLYIFQFSVTSSFLEVRLRCYTEHSSLVIISRFPSIQAVQRNTADYATVLHYTMQNEFDTKPDEVKYKIMRVIFNF